MANEHQAYALHARLLAGERLPIDANDPWSGFYRIRLKSRTGEWSPIAYWYDSHTKELRCQIDGHDINERQAQELWPYAAKNPVSRNDFSERQRTGKWPGEHEAVIGHNVAPPDDTPESIGERIEDLAREADRLIKRGAANTEADSDQASDLANTLGELESKCTLLHKVEKDPHLNAGRAVDATWFPLRDRARQVKALLKQIVVTPYLMRRQME